MRLLALLIALSSPPAGPAKLVDPSGLIADLAVDLRYAKEDNFLKRPVYPADARCQVVPDLAKRLSQAAKSLRAQGFRVLAWDCYRPFAVQKQMWALFPHRGYVADPGRGGSHHNRGAAIDLTLLTREGEPVEMPTPFDTFTRAAYRRYAGGTASSRKNRDLLVRAMEAAGLKPNPMEWWHFELEDAIDYPILDAPLAP